MKDPIFRAADSGDPYACLGVAYYYHEGKEVDFDIDAAITWYERAAARGCPRAHWELAKLFIEGKEVLPTRACTWTTWSRPPTWGTSTPSTPSHANTAGGGSFRRTTRRRSNASSAPPRWDMSAPSSWSDT